jgi:hypothetical protein
VNLTTADLAARWGVHPGSLANARTDLKKPHPGYRRIMGRVLYPLSEVEDFERANSVPARQGAA